MTFIMTARELRERLGEPGLIVVDVRPRPDFEKATIPNAINLNVYDYFIPASDEDGIRDLEAATARAFSATGIDRARTVVYFEEQTGMISPRGQWFHDYADLSGGAILDGGIHAWRATGGQLEPGNTGTSEAIVSLQAGSTPAPPMHRELIATTQQVLDCHDHIDLLDVRRRSEFEGTFAHPCCARAGRIPGAKFLFWEDLIVEGRYRDAGEIASLAAAADLQSDREVITYCHRGARAATAMYALKLAGFESVRVFVGSWHEWASRTDLPIATGD
jgi:thiosulfate/3-mercaptopyruvate sulfurtransferase